MERVENQIILYHIFKQEQLHLNNWIKSLSLPQDQDWS